MSRSNPTNPIPSVENSNKTPYFITIFSWVLIVILAFRIGASEPIGPEEDCLLHPWGPINIDSTASCLATPPKLTVSTTYRCEECGNLRPITPISAIGFGECNGSGTCDPVLQSINYFPIWMSISIQNKRSSLFFICQNSGVTDAMSFCACPGCNSSPILVPLHDGPLQLTGPEDGVFFDLTADGTPERTAWTRRSSNDAFLALDRNGNGYIDNGSELFGDATPQPILDSKNRNGFEALGVFDDSLNGGNEDNAISALDAIFNSLVLWIDLNHNGSTEENETVSLAEAGVGSIDLAYRSSTRVDEYGNEFRYYSSVGTRLGTRTAWDVFFTRD